MKCSIINKREKIVVLIIISLLLVVLWTVLINEWITTKDAEAVYLAIEAAGFVVANGIALNLYVYCFTTVTINQDGISIGIGKIKFNSTTWDNIEKVQLVANGVGGKYNRLLININLKGKATKNKRVYLNIYSKKCINFLYRLDAYKTIEKYYNGEIENSYLASSFTGNGTSRKSN